MTDPRFAHPAPAPGSLSAFARRLSAFIAAGGIEPVFGELAVELFRLQYEANPAYRRLCDHGGWAPGRVAGWREIPAVPALAFKELEMTALPAEARCAVFHSSGTTGQAPSRHHHSLESLALYRVSLLAGFVPLAAACSLEPDTAPPQCRLVFLTPPPEEVPRSSLVHMLGAVGEQYGTRDSVFVGATDPANGSWVLDPGRLESGLSRAADSGQPVFLLGTAFNFVHLADHCGRRGRGFRLGPGSAVMETGGYKGRSRELTRDALHAAIGESLGVPRDRILREYGMSELSSQAYDGPAAAGASRCFRFPPWARACVISPETGREVADGEVGLVRVWDLANVWSVQVLQTEDLAERRGDGFELRGRAPRSEARGCSLMARS